MRISDWSSDVCFSDLLPRGGGGRRERPKRPAQAAGRTRRGEMKWSSSAKPGLRRAVAGLAGSPDQTRIEGGPKNQRRRSEEHTSELQSLMRISYAVFCLKKKKRKRKHSKEKEEI